MDHRRVLINAGSSVVQFALNAVILIVLYRFLLQVLGAAGFGVWSLVLSVSSVTQIAGFGFAGGAVRFVARYVARREHGRAAAVIQTSTLSVVVCAAVALLLAYPVFRSLLVALVSAAERGLVESILPFAVLSVWWMMVAAVLLSSLEGYQRLDIRNALLLASSVLNLVLCLAVVPKYGLRGLTLLGAVQNAFLALAAWIALKRLNPRLPVFPRSWDARAFREVIGYNAQLQGASVLALVCDPVTKSLLTTSGGLGVVAFYEMANRIVLQVRGFVVAANQALAPAVAGLHETAPAKVPEYFRESFTLTCVLSFPIFASLGLMAEAVSALWIGHVNVVFVWSLAILLVGQFASVLAAPAYFGSLGHGTLRWNLLAHVLLLLVNGLGGWLLVLRFGWLGAVVGWALALAVSAAVLLWSYGRLIDARWRLVFTRATGRVLLFGLAGLAVLFGAGTVLAGRVGTLPRTLVSTGLFLSLSLPLVLRHPSVARLIGMASGFVRTRRS